MTTSPHLSIVAFRAILVALALACCVGPGSASAADDEMAGEFFQSGYPPTLSIHLADGAADRLRENPRGSVPCTLTVDGDTTHEDVAIRLKGAAGSFQDLDGKPAFTLTMDRFRPGRRFHGLDKFHLNNSVQDASLLDEWLGGALFRAAGIPAARVTHARVILDDRDLGMYVFKEALDHDFLKRHFDDSSGNLYDGGSGVDIDTLSERDVGKNGVPGADLKALAAACRTEDPDQRWAAIEERLDVTEFITFMALELMTAHWDGYTTAHNNYRIYIDPGNGGRARFIPHGMDQILGDPQAPILDPPPTLVAAAVMDNPAWRNAFREKVRELLPLFDADGRLLPLLEEQAGRLRPVVAESGEEALAAWDEAVSDLRQRIAAREENLREQASAPEPEPTHFDDARRAVLAGWSPRVDDGTALVEEIDVEGDGRRLSIAVEGGEAAIASWRVAIELPPGKYLFQGLAIQEGVDPLEDDPTSGAGLRISGGTRDERVDVEGEWTLLGHVFEVESTRTVELVAELRARQGRVWFNAGSLCLLRLSAP